MFRSKKSDSSRRSSRGTDDESQYYSDSSVSRKSVASATSLKSGSSSPLATRSNGVVSNTEQDLRKALFLSKNPAPLPVSWLPSPLAKLPDLKPLIDATSGRIHLRYTSIPIQERRRVRFVCISDTHGKELDVPMGDVLVHSGDLSRAGTPDSLEATLRWLMRQAHPIKM